MESPEIKHFLSEIDLIRESIKQFKLDSHSNIKIQSLLNITLYVLATRFLEGSIKHIIFNNIRMKNSTSEEIEFIRSELKKFNNPEFKNIKELFLRHLQFDIIDGKIAGIYEEKDITKLNEIVNNRHKNVHTSEERSEWYGSNLKDSSDFEKEFDGLLNILSYLTKIKWNPSRNSYEI